jgi:hypothetical protein
MVGLYRLDTDGPLRLAAELDRAAEAATVVATPRGPQWLSDGTARCVIEDRGVNRVIDIHPDGSWTSIIIPGMKAMPNIRERKWPSYHLPWKINWSKGRWVMNF